jgi:hypothetical protein
MPLYNPPFTAYGGAAISSRNLTQDTAVSISSGGAGGVVQAENFTGAAFNILNIDGTQTNFKVSGVAKAVLNSTTFDVQQLLRCDTFRIDIAPTAETPSATHTVPFNANGVAYKLLCVVA